MNFRFAVLPSSTFLSRCRGFFLVVKGPAADATDGTAALRLLAQPCDEDDDDDDYFCPFPNNGAPVE
jgi:hypothetical protein